MLPRTSRFSPGTKPNKLYALLRQFYEVSPATHMLAVPYMPYLNWAPSAWVLPLKFTGGGYLAGGKCMFDSEGNLWVGDNFTVGLAGTRLAVAGTRNEVRAQRKAALSDHHRIHRRRDGRRHIRRCRRFS